jgi:hypothetical protein
MSSGNGVPFTHFIFYFRAHSYAKKNSDKPEKNPSGSTTTHLAPPGSRNFAGDVPSHAQIAHVRNFE